MQLENDNNQKSSEKKVNFLISAQNITVNFDGKTHIVDRTSPVADQLYRAIKEENWGAIPDIISIARKVKNFSNGDFEVIDGELLVEGQKVPSQLATKILEFEKEGLPHKPLVEFAKKLLQNPSFRAVNELFQFLEKNNHPITPSGNLIAFKRVRHDFKDIYSGKFDNSPGQIVKMPRNQVDEDQNRTCSNGLHISNFEYAHLHYASSDPSTDIMIEVEVNPKDVVAVPVDYSNSKMRVSEYLVIGTIDKELSGELLRGHHVSSSSSDEDDFDDSEDDDDDWDQDDGSFDNEENNDSAPSDPRASNDPIFHEDHAEDHDPWDNHQD